MPLRAASPKPLERSLVPSCADIAFEQAYGIRQLTATRKRFNTLVLQASHGRGFTARTTTKAGAFPMVSPRMAIDRSAKETQKMLERISRVTSAADQRCNRCQEEWTRHEKLAQHVEEFKTVVERMIKVREAHLDGQFQRDTVQKLIWDYIHALKTTTHQCVSAIAALQRSEHVLGRLMEETSEDCSRKKEALQRDQEAAECGATGRVIHSRRHLVPHSSWHHSRTLLIADIEGCIRDAERECVKAAAKRRERVLVSENLRLKVLELLVDSIQEKEKVELIQTEKLHSSNAMLENADKVNKSLEDQIAIAAKVAETSHCKLEERHKRPLEECVEDAADHALLREIELAEHEHFKMVSRMEQCIEDRHRMQIVRDQVAEKLNALKNRIAAEVDSHNLLHQALAVPQDSLQGFRRPENRRPVLDTGRGIRAPRDEFKDIERRIPRLGKFNPHTPRAGQVAPSVFWSPPWPRPPSNPPPSPGGIGSPRTPGIRGRSAGSPLSKTQHIESEPDSTKDPASTEAEAEAEAPPEEPAGTLEVGEAAPNGESAPDALATAAPLE